MTDRLIFESTGPHTARIRFNRPDRLNALDRASVADLHALLGRLHEDPALRAVVITGTGRAFSAGADLKEMNDAPRSESLRETRDQLHLYQDVTRRMVNSPIVFIAALNGIAVGIGAELSLASDIRIGTEASELMFSEVTRGLFETNGVMHSLPRVVGQGWAARWLLTGERVKAETLLQSGFLSELVPAADLLPRATELAERIAGNAPISVRMLKQLLRRTWEVDLEGMLQYEVDGMMACLASDDLEEGLRAFLEKRPPRWSGR